MHLVDQAKAALAQGQPDAAIPYLEKAVSIDVQNGDAFLGLARAWRMKGSRNKAIEFARKAEVFLQENRSKLKEVYLLEADIYKDIGEMKKMDLYREKASKL
jgi:Tfp pilus assembly protein PilF